MWKKRLVSLNQVKTTQGIPYHNNKYVIIIFVIFISWNEAKLSYVCVWHNMTLLEMHIQLLIYLKQMNIYG